MPVDLRILDDQKLKWRLPDDDIARQVLIPALKAAEGFDCMVGFFGAQALRELAPGLAAFVASGNQPMRLLVSPLLSDDDLASVRLGLTTTELVLADAIGASLLDATSLEDALIHHTLHCLAYLLAAGRLQMRVVAVDDGIFHLKEWIFRAGEDLAVLSGSANFTGRAIAKNIESLHLHRSWRDVDNLDTCTESLAEFELLWAGRKRNSRTVDLPTAIAEDLIRTYGKSVPTEADFERALSSGEAAAASQHSAAFAIPSYLQIDEGPYEHQGRAVAKWEENDRVGILAMATGAGKTISALVSARRMLDRTRQLLIVIAVPTRPLVGQWAEECAEFGLRPIVAPGMAKAKRYQTIQLALDNLTFGVSEVETVIVTNDGLVDPNFRQLLDDYDGQALLIADEVHNLGGVKEFLSSPPGWPTARLGLSATPIRQYDDEGTEALLRYFGEVVFEFTLDDAIGVCLVPYDYYVHPVELTEVEREHYAALTDRIRRRLAIVGGAADDDLQLTILLNQRRLVLETAQGKLAALESIIDRHGPQTVRRALFYATDKDPDQMVAVNELLRRRRIRAHQVTEAETSRGRLLSATMRAFSDGILQALTAKRVLDEGLNVPQIDTAYILASTTVRKQWVQRRGRVLRPSPQTGKTHATIHDFVVIPPLNGTADPDEKRLVQSELERADEFARLARNRASASGPLAVLNEIRLNFLV